MSDQAPVAIDWNSIVGKFEGQVVQILSSQLMSGLVTNYAWIASFGLTPVIGLFFGYLIGLGIKYGDWLTFMIADGWENTTDGQAYADAAYQLANFPESASPADRAKLEQAQKDAFDRLMGVAQSRSGKS